MDYLAEVEKAIKNIKTINNPVVSEVEQTSFNNSLALELDKSEKEMIEKNYKKPWSRLNVDQKTKLLLDYSKTKNADFSVLKNALRDKILTVKYNQDTMKIEELSFVESKIKVKEIEKDKNKITELNIE
jgi:hypothetical protein